MFNAKNPTKTQHEPRVICNYHWHFWCVRGGFCFGEYRRGEPDSRIETIGRARPLMLTTIWHGGDSGVGITSPAFFSLREASPQSSVSSPPLLYPRSLIKMKVIPNCQFIWYRGTGHPSNHREIRPISLPFFTFMYPLGMEIIDQTFMSCEKWGLK